MATAQLRSRGEKDQETEAGNGPTRVVGCGDLDLGETKGLTKYFSRRTE